MGARWIVRDSPRFSRVVIDRERTTVPAGKFTAWVLRGASELYGPDDRVRFWYVPASAGDAPTVLYLHGARHNLNGNAHRIERLHALGFNVLALEYRGFGQSTPILPSEQSAIEDAQLAFAELQRREPDAARRIVYGKLMALPP